MSASSSSSATNDEQQQQQQQQQQSSQQAHWKNRVAQAIQQSSAKLRSRLGPAGASTEISSPILASSPSNSSPISSFTSSSPVPALPPKKPRPIPPGAAADANSGGGGESTTVLCGWLRKKGQRRWFLQHDTWLFWFAAEQPLVTSAPDTRDEWFRTARNYLYLPGCVVLQAPDDVRSIELRTETSVYVLRADSKEVAEDWILSLGLAACAPSRRSVLAPPPTSATAVALADSVPEFVRDVIDRDGEGDDNAAGIDGGVPSLALSAASASSARSLRDAALCDVLMRLQLTADPLRAFARYANVHSSTSDADVAALFGCGPDGALGSAPRFFVALQHHQLVLFASSTGASGNGGAMPQANIDLLGCRVEYGVLALGVIIITDAAKNRHLMFLDNANVVDEWVVALRDATYQHGMRPPSSIGAWLEVQFADGDSAQAAEATVAETAAATTTPSVGESDDNAQSAEPARDMSRRSFLPLQQQQRMFRGTERLIAGRVMIGQQACFATVNDGAFTWYAAGDDIAARARFVNGQTVIGTAPATDFIGCVQLSSVVRIVPTLPSAWLPSVEKSDPSRRRSVVASRNGDKFGFEIVAPRYLLAMASGAAAHVEFVPPNPLAEESGAAVEVADARDEVVRVSVTVQDPAHARQWTLALRHARACAPPLGVDGSASTATPPTADAAAGDSDSDSDEEADEDSAGLDLSGVPTCEGWLLKGGQWRFFRLENEQLMWFDRQHTRRLRGKALVSLCSVFSATDDVLSFVVERDSSWSRTMHATSVDDSTTWQSYLVDVVRAAAERSVSLYARTAKARGDVQQRAGWAVLHGQKVWLLLRGGLMVWFATPAPSSRARGCLRLARAGLASLPRNAETVAKSGVLNVRTAGGRRLEFHVAEHFSEWHHDIVFAIQLANDVAPREAQLARQPSAIQRTHRSILHRLQFATGSLSSSVAPQSANSTRSTASGRAGTVGSGSPAATIAANANNSPPGSGQLTRKARMQSDRRTVVLEQHINHGLFPGSKVTAPSTGTASPPPVDSENEPVRDVYGFVVPQAHIDVYDAFLQKFVGSLREKTQLCQALIETPEACGDLDLASLVHRRGIAPRYRGAFWQAFVGADVRVASDPERYEKLARAAAAAADSFATAAPAPLSPRAAMASATYQIELDIGRTFPGLSEDVAFRDSLRAVLYAYAAHNPSVGYTQSMNMLAGIFLVFMPPASAFWMLEYVVTTLMPFTFNDQLVGCFADADVLVLLAERELPQLVRHCNEIDLQFSMFATQWFMCLFVLSFPSETAFRIWDRVLYSGPGAIFDVALRALRCAEKKILATTDAFDAMAALNATTSAMYDADVLFATKLKHEIDHGWVKLLRNKFRKLRLLS